MSLCRGHIACKELRASPLFLRVKFPAHRFTLLGTKLHVRCYIEHAHRRRCNSWFWTLCVFPTVCVCVHRSCKESKHDFSAWECFWERWECLRETRMPGWSIFSGPLSALKQLNFDIYTCQVTISFPLGPKTYFTETFHHGKSVLLFHSFPFTNKIKFLCDG